MVLTLDFRLWRKCRRFSQPGFHLPTECERKDRHLLRLHRKHLAELLKNAKIGPVAPRQNYSGTTLVECESADGEAKVMRRLCELEIGLVQIFSRAWLDVCSSS